MKNNTNGQRILRFKDDFVKEAISINKSQVKLNEDLIVDQQLTMFSTIEEYLIFCEYLQGGLNKDEVCLQLEKDNQKLIAKINNHADFYKDEVLAILDIHLNLYRKLFSNLRTCIEHLNTIPNLGEETPFLNNDQIIISKIKNGLYLEELNDINDMMMKYQNLKLNDNSDEVSKLRMLKQLDNHSITYQAVCQALKLNDEQLYQLKIKSEKLNIKQVSELIAIQQNYLNQKSQRIYQLIQQILKTRMRKNEKYHLQRSLASDYSLYSLSIELLATIYNFHPMDRQLVESLEKQIATTADKEFVKTFFENN